MKITIILIYLFLLACTEPHPNIDSPSIVWDKTLKEVVKSYKKPAFATIKGLPDVKPTNSKPLIIAPDSMKIALIEYLKEKNILHSTGFPIHILSSRNTVISVIIGKFDYIVTEFQTNKTINKQDDLIIIGECFQFAFAKAYGSGNIMFNEQGQAFYDDLDYYQFRYFNISEIEIKNKNSNLEVISLL